MNLLNYKNRFKEMSFTPTNVSEVNGYLWAMQDLLAYLEEKTEFTPAKRMVDSVDLLDCIADTNLALKKVYQREEKDLKECFKELAGVDYGSSKVNKFLGQEDLVTQLRQSETF